MSKVKKRKLPGILIGLFLLFSCAGQASASAMWDLTGTYSIETIDAYNNSYIHSMTINTIDLTTGVFSGTGYYIPNPSYSWTITGTESGSTFTSHIQSLVSSLYSDHIATIELDGSFQGTWTQSDGNYGSWHSISGAAKPVPNTPVATPEPGTVFLFVAGLLGLGGTKLRQRITKLSDDVA